MCASPRVNGRVPCVGDSPPCPGRLEDTAWWRYDRTAGFLGKLETPALSVKTKRSVPLPGGCHGEGDTRRELDTPTRVSDVGGWWCTRRPSLVFETFSAGSGVVDRVSDTLSSTPRVYTRSPSVAEWPQDRLDPGRPLQLLHSPVAPQTDRVPLRHPVRGFGFCNREDDLFDDELLRRLPP